jgi:hypothetical protein
MHSYKTHEKRWWSMATWRLKFSLLPRRCALSGRLLWFRWAYHGSLLWTGPGEPVEEIRWHDPDEHLLWRLCE